MRDIMIIKGVVQVKLEKCIWMPKCLNMWMEQVLTNAYVNQYYNTDTIFVWFSLLN